MSAPNLEPRELACVLAALRFWQVRNLPRVSQAQLRAIEQIAAGDGPALDCEEIDTLCARLNAPTENDQFGALVRHCLSVLNASDAEHPEFLDSACDTIDLFWDYENEIRSLAKILSNPLST